MLETIDKCMPMQEPKCNSFIRQTKRKNKQIRTKSTWQNSQIEVIGRDISQGALEIMLVVSLSMMANGWLGLNKHEVVE